MEIEEIKKEFDKWIMGANLPTHLHRTDRISYFDLLRKPTFYHRTSVSVDLSGAAATLVAFHTEKKAEILRAYLLYTEASSADAGITVEVGKESDRDFYYTGASETEKAIWYTKELTLLNKVIPAGDTVTFYSPGSKVGTGEIMLVLEINFLAI
jgi:hypothetical protein